MVDGAAHDAVDRDHELRDHARDRRRAAAASCGASRRPASRRWQGSAQITTASADRRPGPRYVYAASPDGLVHKLSLANGREARGLAGADHAAPRTEKLTASLNIAGGDLLASTGGYFGDAPPYVGHVVAVSLASGHVDARLQHAVREPHDDHRSVDVLRRATRRSSRAAARSSSRAATRVLIATGNAPVQRHHRLRRQRDRADASRACALRQAYTPTDQAKLNTGDTDLGSGSPALLPGDLVLDRRQGRRSCACSTSRALDGQRAGRARRAPAASCRRSRPPAAPQLFSAPAVWHDIVFVATAAARRRHRRLPRRRRAPAPIWQNGTHGTSPISPAGCSTSTTSTPAASTSTTRRAGRRSRRCRRRAGHWNSPIVVDGHVIEPTGNDNDHARPRPAR